MKWKIVPLLYAAVVFCALLVLVCIVPRYRHYAVWLLAANVIIQFVFAFVAIAEMNCVPNFTKDQKRWWRDYLLTSPLIFGFAYLKFLRSRFPNA
jgi:hypothetical protein